MRVEREILEHVDHPILYNKTPHPSRSARYLVITTAERLVAIEERGWRRFRVGLTKSKREGWQKHYVLLKNPSIPSKHGIDASLLVTNSYDGSCKFRFYGSIYRQVSDTWMVGEESEDTCAAVAVRHWIYVDPILNEQVQQTLATLPDLSEQTARLLKRELTKAEQRAFARAATKIRYPEKIPAMRIDPDDLLASRRVADEANDALTTLSKVQEHLIEGGVPGVNRKGYETVTRPLAEIKRVIELKQALWILVNTLEQTKLSEKKRSRSWWEKLLRIGG